MFAVQDRKVSEILLSAFLNFSQKVAFGGMSGIVAEKDDQVQYSVLCSTVFCAVHCTVQYSACSAVQYRVKKCSTVRYKNCNIEI